MNRAARPAISQGHARTRPQASDLSRPNTRSRRAPISASSPAAAMPAACRPCSGRCPAERPRSASGVKLGRVLINSPSRVRFWANRTSSRHGLRAESGPEAAFGSIHKTCLSAWSHRLGDGSVVSFPPLHERPPTGGSHVKLHRTTKILSHAWRRGCVGTRGARGAAQVHARVGVLMPFAANDPQVQTRNAAV